MFLCECGHSFENPRYCAGDRVPYGDTYASFGDYAVCPVCGSDDILEADECACCGEVTALSDMTEGFCGKCVDDTLKRFDNLLAKEFTDEEIAVIKAVWE